MLEFAAEPYFENLPTEANTASKVAE